MCLSSHQRVADADDAGCEDAGEPVVRGAGGEDLAVRGLVGEERELREDDAERAGDEQLEPAVAEQDEAGDAPAEREQDAPRRRGGRTSARGCSRPVSRTTCESCVYARVRCGKLAAVA